MASVFLTGELVRLAAAEAQYHAAHGRYTSNLDSLPEGRRGDILIQIQSADATGWEAIATWPALPIHCQWKVLSPAAPLPTFAEVARGCVVA